MNRLSLGAAAAVLMLAAGAVPALAAGKCVRVIGYEWRGEAQSADPADMVTIDDAMRVDAIYEGLAYLDNDYQPQPVLAESWVSNADGSEWTFHLRKAVKFHDGKDFTAKDVIYTFKRLLDEKTNSGARHPDAVPRGQQHRGQGRPHRRLQAEEAGRRAADADHHQVQPHRARGSDA